MNRMPAITREALEERIRSEVANLGADALSWWSAHRVEPFVVDRDGFAHYAIARTCGTPLIYFDRHRSFGQFSEHSWDDGLLLYDDLADAIRCLTTREELSLLLSETASSLLRLGFLDRKVKGLDIRERTMKVLRAFGPDAAVAVPKLFEIISKDEIRGGLHEDAVVTLATIGPAAAPTLPKLIEMAEHDTANARGWCLQAFESIGPAAASAVPLLIDLLRKRVSFDPDPFYVSLAADALGNIGAIDALPALLQALRETDDPSDAAALVQALGKLGPDAAEAVPSLVDLTGDDRGRNRFHESEDVRQVAREALDRIGRAKSTDPHGS